MRKKNVKLYNVAIFSFLILFILGCFSAIGNLLKKDENTPVTIPVATQTEVPSIVEASDVSGTTDASPSNRPEVPSVVTSTVSQENNNSFSYDAIPAYSGDPYYIVNNNTPYFKPSEITATVFENYSDLDSSGRCGVAFANICRELMPTDSRGDIGNVKPSGWTYNGKSNNNKYDFVDGKYIYNRCHLIGFQLAGENANEKNLITGTRYLNVDGMLPFENLTADYVKNTGNHVLYRITPVFVKNEMVCRGLLMEAYSVEDNGNGLEFCVWCYNVQPGVEIKYATGQNWLESEGISAPSAVANEPAFETGYMVNDNTMKFHLPSCKYASTASRNQRYVNSSRETLIDEGYVPCKNCNP